MIQHQNKAVQQDQKMFFIILAAALLITMVFVFWPKGTASQQLSARATFAACLSSKGVIMYGTDTCPSCQEQKGMFEDDFRRTHYINCDIHQDECMKNNIQGYPTWMYNGQSLQGVQTFNNLSRFSGCAAP